MRKAHEHGGNAPSRKTSRALTRRALLATLGATTSLLACGHPETGDDTPESDDETLVQLDPAGGAFAQETLEVSLCPPQELPVVYTLDGSLPTAESTRAQGMLTLDASDVNAALIDRLREEHVGRGELLSDSTLPTATALRASALLPDKTLGVTTTATYLLDTAVSERFGEIMVVSLVTDPANLLDPETGIMAKGTRFVQNQQANDALIAEDRLWEIEANFTQKGRDWEREGHIELIDGQGEVVFAGPCGLRLRGRFSRIFSQKSFNIYFRNEYGLDEMAYPLFGDESYDSDAKDATRYEGFALRAGGNTTLSLKFKDDLLQELLAGATVSTQASRPALLFLNGEFYGAVSLLERYTDEYLHRHFGVAANNVIVYEEGKLDEGEPEDEVFYEELMAFVDRDLSDLNTWEQFCAVVDTTSMADCLAAEVYIGNPDWNEEHNSRLWRTREKEPDYPEGDMRWRFMLYDLEYSSGLYGFEETTASYDTLTRALSQYPLFASAMRNAQFQQMVRARMVELSQGALAGEHVSAALDQAWEQWLPWIRLNELRFGGDESQTGDDRDRMRDFFMDRPRYVFDLFDAWVGAIDS